MAPAPTLFRCPACGGPVATTAASCPHCGYRPPIAISGTSLAALGLGLGGLLVAGGSFLPWATVSGLVSMSLSGLDGGDGVFTLGLGIVLALVGVVSFSTDKLGLWLRAVGFLAGLGALAIAIYDGIDVARAISDVSSTGLATASVGFGIFVVGAGAGIAILASVFGGLRNP